MCIVFNRALQLLHLASLIFRSLARPRAFISTNKEKKKKEGRSVNSFILLGLSLTSGLSQACYGTKKGKVRIFCKGKKKNHKMGFIQRIIINYVWWS